MAFVCDVSYGAALKRYFRRSKLPMVGYFCRDIVKALSNAGRRYGYRQLKRPARFMGGTMVFVGRSARYLLGHYLVKTSSGWTDPWVNYSEIKTPRAGFSRELPGKAKYAAFPEPGRFT